MRRFNTRNTATEIAQAAASGYLGDTAISSQSSADIDSRGQRQS